MTNSTASGLTSAFSFLIFSPKSSSAGACFSRASRPARRSSSVSSVSLRAARRGRPLGRTIADLLDDLALFLFGSFQLPGNLLALVGFVLDGRCEVMARLSGDVVE